MTPETTRRRSYVADIDASIAVMQDIHDGLRHQATELTSQADEIGKSIGRLSTIRHQIMDGVFADEARARTSQVAS